MAAPKKEKLTYFSFDTSFFQDEKIEYLDAEIPHLGPYVFIQLLCKIYTNSYFLEWKEKQTKMMARKTGIDQDVIINTVNVSINEGLFCKDIYEKYGVLTSKSIQERYVMAVNRRKCVQMIKEYLLINPKDNERYKRQSKYGDVDIASIKYVNASINQDNVDTMSTQCEQYDDINSQSKVKESKVKETKLKENNNIHTREEKKESSLSYLKIVFEDKELWKSPVKYLSYKQKSLDEISKYYTTLMKLKSEKKLKPFDDSDYLKATNLALQGKNDWDVDGLLKTVQNDVEKRYKRSMAIEENRNKNEIEKKQDSEKEIWRDYAMSVCKTLSKEDREKITSQATEFIKKSLNGSFNVKSCRWQIEERIARIIYEKGYAKREDAFKKETVNV